jgi:hypothetical protein
LLSHFSPSDNTENCSAQFLSVCWIVHVELRTRASNSNFAFAVLRKEVFAVRVFSFFRCDVDCLRLPLRLPLFFRRSLVKNQF